jgi:uncharacterized protein YqeY
MEPSPPSSPSPIPPADRLVARLKADLLVARKAKDGAAATACRTLLAAVENAEAPPIDTAGAAAPATVGRLVDVARHELTEADLEAIVEHEIADRLDTIEQIAPYDRAAEVDALRAEVAVIERYRS